MDTVLITGASGFIGKHLLKKLSGKKEYNIILLTGRPIEDFQYVLHKDYTFTCEDFVRVGVCDIDYVIHLGAFTPKSGMEANQVEKCNSNIWNTKYLLENIPKPKRKILFASTLDVYGRPNGILSEDSPTLPLTLYGLSKLYCEKMLTQMCDERNIPLQIVRIGHIYGSGEAAYKKFIPEAIRSVKESQEIRIFSDGLEKRAFLHIDDCCEYLLRAMELSEECGVINLASARSETVLKIAQILADCSEKNVNIDVQGRAIAVNDFCFDTKKCRRYLGEERVALEEGLKQEFDDI